MNYSELNVPEQIHKAVERMGFTEMTEVQEKAIPPMMEGKDIIAKAPTGTGKTCAFGIPKTCRTWRIFIRTSASSPSMAARIFKSRSKS